MKKMDFFFSQNLSVQLVERISDWKVFGCSITRCFFARYVCDQWALFVISASQAVFIDPLYLA